MTPPKKPSASQSKGSTRAKSSEEARATPPPRGTKARPARISPREGRASAARGDETRALILEVALGLFRKQGLEATTMRAIADQAGVALGSAYYYFPSKEAIVLAYYEETQRRVAPRVHATFAATSDVGERLVSVLQERIDAIARDRKLLSALFRSIGNPDDDLSVFSARTADLREAGVGLFEEALSVSPEIGSLSAEARTALGLALWMLQLASILYMVHDDSPKLARTRKLVTDTVGLFVAALPMLPVLSGAFGDRVIGILRDAALLRSP